MPTVSKQIGEGVVELFLLKAAQKQGSGYESLMEPVGIRVHVLRLGILDCGSMDQLLVWQIVANYYFGGSLIQLKYNKPQNPILIIKAQALSVETIRRLRRVRWETWDLGRSMLSRIAGLRRRPLRTAGCEPFTQTARV